MASSTQASQTSASWSVTEKIFAATFFPLTLVSSLALYQFLIPDMHPFVAYLVCTPLIVIPVICFERIFPNNKRWNVSRGDVLTDTGHVLTVGAVSVLPIWLFRLGKCDTWT